MPSSSALGFGVDRHHIADIMGIDGAVNVVQIGRLAAQANAIVDHFTANLTFGDINERHLILISRPLAPIYSTA
jgi:hypothetical protein